MFFSCFIIGLSVLEFAKFAFLLDLVNIRLPGKTNDIYAHSGEYFEFYSPLDIG
jgi:hypothetical protein